MIRPILRASRCIALFPRFLALSTMLTFAWSALAQESKTTEPQIQVVDSPNKQLPKETPLINHSYDDAIAKAERLELPMLVILGAEWCGPCKQLEKELQEPTAKSIFDKWIVVKVDIDEESALAKQWQVNAVPAFRILSLEQEVVASNEGYGGLKKLQTWLSENFDSANPRTQRLLRDNQPVDAKLATELIALLRDRRPENRKWTIERLAKSKAFAAGPVVEVLSSGNLSQKICALEILEKWSAPIAGMDAWTPDTITGERLTSLKDWLQQILRQENPK